MIIVRGLELVTDSFFQDQQLTVRWNWLPGDIDFRVRTRSITWDPEVTTLVGARLHGVITAPAGCSGQIYFNRTLTHWCDARVSPGKVDVVEDVKALLVNGTNEVRIELTKFAYFVADLTATFTVELVLEYSGVMPESGPPEEPFVFVWPWWTTLALIGG